MSYGLSPSIDIRERDFLTPGRQTANRFAGMVGNFNWGPVNEKIQVTDEKSLVEMFHQPDNLNYRDWWVANNYLSYNDKLVIVRAIKEAGSLNAGIAFFSEALKRLNVTGASDEFELAENVVGGVSAANGTVYALEEDAVYIKVNSGTFEEDELITGSETSSTATVVTIDDDVKTCKFSALKKNFDHEIEVPAESLKKFKFIAKYCGSYGNNISVAIARSVDFATAMIVGTTSFKSRFEFAPTSTEVAVAILVNGAIAETHLVSLTPGARNYRNESYFIDSYLARYSKYVYSFTNTQINSFISSPAVAFSAGAHVAPEAADYILAYNNFDNSEELDIDVLFSGCIDITGGATVIQHMIDNVAEVRRDCRIVFGARKVDVVNKDVSTAVANMLTFISTDINKDSTFAAFYGNYKYQYDRYNDEYRWIPIDGDIAGIYSIGQAWESPAGLNRGIIKNCIKLAVNPKEGLRDSLYPAAVNPVYTIKNVGHVVMGQKTLKTSVPTLFSSVDIRGLFILLQKNAKDIARFYQFQKNTPVERRRFVADIEPLFTNIQGLGGIEEYLIVCDDSNNNVSKTMIADFYVRPTESAEWIQLNFNATTGIVNFEDIVASPRS